MTSHRAIVYVRLSNLTETSLSPERQEEACRAYATAKGWPVVEVVQDLDISGSDRGKRLERPGLERIRELWQPGDVVVFAKLDRLARNVIDFRTFADEAEAAGAALASVAESLDLTTPGGRFVATILAAFAEMESATTAERVKASIKTVRRARRFPGGRVPYGYRTAKNPDGPGRVLEPDPVTSAVVREMADRVLAGESAYAISQDLNKRGIKTGLGKQWSVSTVRSVLVGDTIVGRVVMDGDVLRDANGMPETVWTPLVTDAESARLRALMLPKKDTPKRRGRQPTRRLAAGLLVCGSCGAAMRVRSKGRGKPPQYQCPKRSDGGLCPQGTSIKAETVDQVLADEFLAAVGRMDATVLVQVTVDNAEVAAVRQELEDTAQAMLAPGADRLGLVERMDALERHLKSLTGLPGQPEYTHEPTGRTVAGEWEDADLATRRGWVTSAVDSVVIHPPGRPEGRITINWGESDTQG